MVFQAWPKTPRLFKDVVVTEKIDGSNACVVVKPVGSDQVNAGGLTVGNYRVYAQSRKRLLPLGPLGMDDVGWGQRDNFGFAAWVKEHAAKLVDTLGEGYHYGEWWGHGIQRGYGLQKGDRRFSLFNTHRWGHFATPEAAPGIPGLGVVPTLWIGPFNTEDIRYFYDELMEIGSQAAPGYRNPEGVIVYHSASGQVYKVTELGDVAKWQLQEAKEAA